MTHCLNTLSVPAPSGIVRSRSSDADGALLRSFFERSGLPIARLDRDLCIVVVNPEFRRVFGGGGGGTRRELPGTPMVDLLHPARRDEVVDQLTELLDEPTGRLVDEQVVVRCGGRMLGCRMTALVVPGEVEPLEGVLLILEPGDRDLLDQREAPHRHATLSEVDARILEGIGVGVSTMQLAAALLLSRGGVEYHVKSLMQRFKVRNRPALISKAYATGVFRVGHWPPRVCTAVR